MYVGMYSYIEDSECTCMCTSICMWSYTCTRIYMGCTCMLVPIYVSSCVHVDASAYVYVRVNVYNEYVIIYVCMCVRMHGCMCKCIYTM